MKKSKPQVAEQIVFSHDQLLKALYYVFDFMDRAMINFYLVGSTGQSIKDHKDLFGSCILAAVRKNEWESGAKRIADAFATPLRETNELVEYIYEGVPIKLYVLPDSELLRSADTTIYASEYFKLPNPFEEFEKQFSWLK
jgi:hypothetical protein